VQNTGRADGRPMSERRSNFPRGGRKLWHMLQNKARREFLFVLWFFDCVFRWFLVLNNDNEKSVVGQDSLVEEGSAAWF
jgi:hypothetical protein